MSCARESVEVKLIDRKQSGNANATRRAMRAQRLGSGARARLCFEFSFDDEIRLASLPR